MRPCGHAIMRKIAPGHGHCTKQACFKKHCMTCWIEFDPWVEKAPDYSDSAFAGTPGAQDHGEVRTVNQTVTVDVSGTVHTLDADSPRAKQQ